MMPDLYHVAAQRRLDFGRGSAAIFLLLATLLSVGRLHAADTHLRIRATSELLQTGALSTEEYVEVRGILRDDLKAPMANALVELPPKARGCDDNGTSPTEGGAPSAVRTDARGRFCLRVPKAATTDRLRVRYPGDDYHTPARAELSLDLERHPLVLGFEAGTLEAALDRPKFATWISAAADSAPAGESVGVRLRLVEPSAAKDLSVVDVPVGGRVRVEIPTEDLGPPGEAQLVARHEGSPTFLSAEQTAKLLRTARVELKLAGELAPARPESGVVLPLAVRATAGAVPNGWVEALRGDRPVGLSRVRSGAARLVATFEAPRAETAALSVRYIASDPAWKPGPALAIQVPLAPPSPWRALPWLAFAAAVGVWILRAWRRPRRGDRPLGAGAPVPPGRPQIELVGTGDVEHGWRGLVMDAHDAHPLASRLEVLVPTFEGEGIAKSVQSTPEGTFEIPPLDHATAEGVRLRVSAPGHTRLEQRMPPPGNVRISLVSRRRALLERLVHWAHDAGAQWVGPREPTPGELAKIADRKDQGQVAAWARAVEHAAFGPFDPDERREDALRSAEPPRPRRKH